MPASRAVEDTRMPLAPPPQRKRGLVDPLDRRERLAEPDDDAGDSAVADDEVGAEAERHDRHLRIEVAQKCDQIVFVLGLEQPFGPPAALEPDQRRERCVGGQLAAHCGMVARALICALACRRGTAESRRPIW